MKKQLLLKEGGTRKRSLPTILQSVMWVAFFSLATLAASAQTRTITGTVVDQANNPVPGASVILEGTTRGTAALGDGTFSLANVPASGTLNVSMMGYTTQSISLTSQNVYRVVLSEDTQFLDEVVVVGYGVMRKSDVTGSMVSVGAEQLQERPVENPFQALQGRAAGVDITNSTRPGELGQIRIRGERSIGFDDASRNRQNSPLYVVDGIPLQGSTDIASINTYDIKSIDILKDASATAIYGSRGANGVVLVTTNRGEEGRFTINYNGSVTISKVVDSAERFSAGEWIDFVRWANHYAKPADFNRADEPTIQKDFTMFGSDKSAWANVAKGWSNGEAWTAASTADRLTMSGGEWNGSRVNTTDWGGMVTRTGIAQNHQLSASGGTERMTSRASFGYYNLKGVSYGQGLERYTLNVASTVKPKSWFELSASVNTTWAIQEYGQDGTGASSGSGARSIYASAMRELPFAVPYDADGNRILTPGGIDGIRNVAEEWKHSRNRRETFNAWAALSARVQLPIEGLTYEFRSGPSFRNRRRGVFVSPLSAVRQATMNLTTLENNREFSWNVDNQVNYIRTFGKHNLVLTLLQTAEKLQTVSDGIDGRNQPAETALWNNMGAINRANDITGVRSDLSERQLTSYMARAQYTFNDKYILTATVRSDGASVLAPGHKWSTFYSAAGAWRLEQEEFIKKISWIQQLKLRLGYGETGSQAVQPYETIASISSLYYPYGTNLQRFYFINNQRPDNRYPDQSLGWETTRTVNAGIDFSILRSRVSGSVDYYHSITSDLLLRATIMPQTGYTQTTSNLGKTQNNGVEFVLNTVNVQTGGFTWESSLNLAWQRNKILELANGKVDEVNDNRFINQPLRVFYNYESAGVWREEDAEEMARFNSNTNPDGTSKTAMNFKVGQARPVDQNGDYVIDATNDRVIIGRRDPSWTGGFNNTFSYKGVELGIMMYGRLGYWGDGGIPALGAVAAHRKIDYYNELNKNAPFHRPVKTTDGSDNDPYHSSQQYYKASFVNVRNISLAYVFPKTMIQKWGIQNIRVYAQVENPFAVYQSVKWKNMDVDSEIWSRNFIFGLNIGF